MKKIILMVFIFSFCSCGGYFNRVNYIERHNQLSDTMKKAIMDKNIIIGMLDSEVILCWGKPLYFKIQGNIQEWRYLYYYKTVIFKDHKVISLKNIGSDFKQAYDNSTIALDMSPQEVEYMWGPPTAIGKEKKDGIMVIYWTYNLRGFPYYKVVFVNDKVISFKDMDAE